MKLLLHLIAWATLGGIESNLINIIEHYPDKNVEHVIAYVREGTGGLDKYYPGFAQLKEKIAQLPTTRLIKRGKSDIIDINDLIKLVTTLKPDVVHSTKEWDAPIVYALHLLTGVPIVQVFHTAPLILPLPFLSVYPSMLKEYPHYQVGNYVGPQFLQNYQHNWPTETLPAFESVANCVDTSKFAPNKENRTSIRKHYNIPDNALVLGSVGVFTQEKRQLWTIKTLEFLQTKYPTQKFYVMLVGTGDLKNELQKYVTEKGLNDYVIFTGLQNNVAPFYNAFDLYLHPSQAETGSLASLEALASGLPAIIYSPQPEDALVRTYGSLKNGFNAQLVYENSHEAFAITVEKVINNADYRAKLRLNARVSVEEFSPARVAQRYHEIFTTASQRPRIQQMQKFKDLFSFYFPLS